MSEMIVDNPNGPLGPIINTTTPESLLAEYNLIMEFIVFQTKELIEPLGIDTLIISGSQSKILDLSNYLLMCVMYQSR